MPKNLVLGFEGYYNKKSHLDAYPLHNIEAYLARSEEQLIFHPAPLNKMIPTKEDFNRSLTRACNFLAQHFQLEDRIFIFATGNGISLASDLATFLSTYGFYQEGDAFYDKKTRNKDLIERYSRARTKSSAADQAMHYGLLSRITKGSIKPSIQFLGYLGFTKNPSEARSFIEPEIFARNTDLQREYFFIAEQTGVVKSERNLQIKVESDLGKAVSALKTAAQSKGLSVLEEPHPSSFLARKGHLNENSTLLSSTSSGKKKTRCIFL